MARYASFALIALFCVIPFGHAADEAQVQDILGAEDAKVVEERSPNYPKNLKPPSYKPTPKQNYYKPPAVQPQPAVTQSLGSLSITPAIALIHACWKSADLSTITYEIKEGIELTGLTAEDILYAKVLVSAVTVKEKAYGYGSGGSSYGKEETVLIAVQETIDALKTLKYGKGIDGIASALAYVVQAVAGNRVSLCLDVVLQLRILEAKVSYPAPKPAAYPPPDYQQEYEPQY